VVALIADSGKWDLGKEVKIFGPVGIGHQHFTLKTKVVRNKSKEAC